MEFEIKPRLMAPGPVPMPQEVLNVLGQQMIHHRAPEFNKTLSRVLDRLKVVFQTSEPVMMLTSTGSGGLEAAIVNLVSECDEVIAVNSGKFGERWGKMAEVYGAKVHWLNVEWGQPVSVSEVESCLQAHPNVKMLLIQACETSTGTLHPIKELSEATKKHNCLIAVDAITAIATTELQTEKWGLDVVVAGSQKAFMLPTGLSFVTLSKKAWELQSQCKTPKFYFNLASEKNANSKGQTFFSSNVSLIKALDCILEKWVTPEGLKAQVAQSKKLSFAATEAIRILGLELLSSNPAPALTAIRTPEGIDGAKLRLHLEEKYQITVMGGQDQLKGKIIRIGHMGHIEDSDLLATIHFLGQSLLDFKVPGVNNELILKAVTTAKTILEGS